MITPPRPAWLSFSLSHVTEQYKTLLYQLLRASQKHFPGTNLFTGGQINQSSAHQDSMFPSVNNSLTPSNHWAYYCLSLPASKIRNVQKLLAQREQQPQFSLLPWNCQQWLEKWSKPVGVPGLKRFNEFNLKSEAWTETFQLRERRSWPRVFASDIYTHVMKVNVKCKADALEDKRD